MLNKKWDDLITNAFYEYKIKMKDEKWQSAWDMYNEAMIEYNLEVEKFKTDVPLMYSWLKDDQVMVYCKIYTVNYS